MIVGQRWGAPWDGNKPGLVQGLTTGPPHLQLTGGNFLSVPGPLVTQMACGATLDLLDTPPGAGRRHDQTTRLGAADAVPRPALRSPPPIAGLGGTDGHGHGPAVVRLGAEVVGASGPSRGETGCEGWGWVSLAGLWGRGGARTPPPHDPHATPRPPRVPPARPGVARGARGAGVGGPARGGRRQGLRRAAPGACVARGAAPRGRRRGRPGGERGAARPPPDDVGRRGPRTAGVLRGRAAGSQAPAGTPGPRWGEASAERPGHRTAGPRGHVALRGGRGLAIPGQAHREAAAVPGPPGARTTPHAQHAVHAPPRALCWAGGAGALAVPGEPLARRPGCLLGGLVTDAPHAGARRHPLDGPADDGTPALPALGGERASAEDRAACNVLDRGGPSAPHRGRAGVAVGRPGPATGSGGTRWPRRRRQEALKPAHDPGAT
jgi:hypothetical protein